LHQTTGDDLVEGHSKERGGLRCADDDRRTGGGIPDTAAEAAEVWSSRSVGHLRLDSLASDQNLPERPGP
jgi:hypothetical protein